jgi:hypothetical protein
MIQIGSTEKSKGAKMRPYAVPSFQLKSFLAPGNVPSSVQKQNYVLSNEKICHPTENQI